MSQAIVNLFNQALSAIGDKYRVTNTTDNSMQAKTANLWFGPARRAVFSAFHWPSLRAVARLSPSAIRAPELAWQNNDPWPGYAYAFQLPNNCVAPRYMSDFSNFELGRSNGVFSLFSNNAAPVLYYTEDVEEPGQWESGLYTAVLYSLAASMNMAANGKANLTDMLSRKVQELIATHATDAANMDNTSYEEIPSHWAGTGFSVPAGRHRYVYPTQTFRVAGV